MDRIAGGLASDRGTSLPIFPSCIIEQSKLADAGAVGMWAVQCDALRPAASTTNWWAPRACAFVGDKRPPLYEDSSHVSCVQPTKGTNHVGKSFFPAQQQISCQLKRLHLVQRSLAATRGARGQFRKDRLDRSAVAACKKFGIDEGAFPQLSFNY